MAARARRFRLSAVQAVGLSCLTGQILLRDKYRRGCAEFHTSPFSTAFPPDDHKISGQPATLQRQERAEIALPFRQTTTRFPGSQRRFSVVEGQGSHCLSARNAKFDCGLQIMIIGLDAVRVYSILWCRCFDWQAIQVVCAILQTWVIICLSYLQKLPTYYLAAKDRGEMSAFLNKIVGENCKICYSVPTRKLFR